MLLQATTTPPISRDLLEYLRRVFPNKLPEVNPGPGVIDWLIGQQRVIAHLQAQYDMQNRDMLGNK